MLDGRWSVYLLQPPLVQVQGRRRRPEQKLQDNILIFCHGISQSVSGFSILLIKINENKWRQNKKDHTRSSTKSNQSVKESSAFARPSTHHTNYSQDHNLFRILVPHTIQQSVLLSGSMISRLLSTLVDEPLGFCWCRKVWLVPGIPRPSGRKGDVLPPEDSLLCHG